MFLRPASSSKAPSEMEDLLQGLKCSLRLSGKIGDSTMMGIICAAMEEAYERILRSKEGGLECLNQKSRFCGLAMMQLDWCLWFLQEEMDDDCCDGEGDERQGLVGDLRATRDRIRDRLDRTEIAIVDKEKEMFELSETVSELRRELDSKDEELRSLRASLDLDGADCRSSPRRGTGGSVALGDLKSIIIHQIDDLSCAFTKEEADLSDDSGEELEIPRSLEKIFETCTQELSILRRRLLLTFDAVDDAGEEQQLLQTLERDVTRTLLQNFLRNVNEKTAMDEPGQVSLEGSGDEFLPWINDERPTQGSETTGPEIYQAEPLEEEAFCSVRSKLEKALRQMTMTRIQLREFGSDLGVPLDGEENSKPSPADDITRTIAETEDDIRSPPKEKSRSSATMKKKEDEWEEIESVTNSLKDFSQHILDLEETASARARENMARLEGLNCEIQLLAQQASSLRGTEWVYRKAFTRRCCNLQTAEAEVDLLGDEVDALMNLLEETYLVLDYYSPVLQCYQGIVGILRRIKRELFGDASAGSHSRSTIPMM